jgi:translin
MDSLSSSLKDVEDQLNGQLDRRERLLKESRDVISSCSKAIVNVHNGRRADALRELNSAKTRLMSLRQLGEGPLARYLISSETEFVEASTVFALARGRLVPTKASLGTSSEAYLLGLLDTVGELKRLTLDSIMEGDIPSAKKHFASMERLYTACSPFAVFDHVANGTRRKLDVARMLVEDVRGVLTEELRRDELETTIRSFEKRLRSGRAATSQ